MFGMITCGEAEGFSSGTLPCAPSMRIMSLGDRVFWRSNPAFHLPSSGIWGFKGWCGTWVVVLAAVTCGGPCMCSPHLRCGTRIRRRAITPMLHPA